MSSRFFRHVLKAARIVAKVACLKLKKKKSLLLFWLEEPPEKKPREIGQPERKGRRESGKKKVNFVLKFSLSLLDP